MYKEKIIDEINRLIGEGYTYKDIFDTFKENGVKNIDGKSFTYDSLRYFIKHHVKPKGSKDNKTKGGKMKEKETETKPKTNNMEETKPKTTKSKPKTDNIEETETKPKTEKSSPKFGKVSEEKVKNFIDDYMKSSSKTTEQMSEKYKISRSSVNKIRSLLQKEYIPVNENTSRPSKYNKGTVEGWVIRIMFDRGWKLN